MVCLTFALALLTLAPLALSQSSGPCVDTCATTNAASSFCNGDETGSALADCTCNSYISATPLITCISKCPTSQVSAFAANVPEKCRSQLFPGVEAAAGTSSAAAATTSATAQDTTGSTSATAQETLASSSASASSAVETLASSTGPAPTGTSSGSGAARNAVAGLGVAAVGGLLAVLAL